MSETPIIGFRLVGVNTTEAGKAASANENALIAEALFKQRVESRSTTDPPASPSNADVYIVPDASASPAPSGAWAGHEDEIAIYYNGWLFVAPINGPVFYVADEDLSVKYDDMASPPAWVVGGASTFIGQSDTPASYSGQAGKVPTVNSGETGLEFGAGGAFSGFRAIQTSAQSVGSSTVMSLDSVSGSNDAFNKDVDVGDLLTDNFFTVPAALDGAYAEFTASTETATDQGIYVLRIERSVDGGTNWNTIAQTGANDGYFGRGNPTTGPIKLASGDLWRVRIASASTVDTTGDRRCFFAMTVLG